VTNSYRSFAAGRLWSEIADDDDDNECHANYGDSESYDVDISVKDRKIS